MKLKLSYIIGFIVIFLVSLILHIPASLVYQWLPKAPGVKLSAISGTPWKGQAAGLEVDKQQVGSLSWDLQGLKLLTANLEYNVKVSGQTSSLGLTAKANIGVGFGGLYAADVIASMPAQAALNLAKLPKSIPVTAQGRLELSMPEFNYAAPWCDSAQADLVWVRPRVINPLGDLAVERIPAKVSCEASTLTLIGGQDDPQVSSHFNIKAEPAGANPMRGSYQVSAWFKPGAEFPQGLNEQLSWLGQANNQGQYPFNFTGRF